MPTPKFKDSIEYKKLSASLEFLSFQNKLQMPTNNLLNSEKQPEFPKPDILHDTFRMQ